MELAQIIKRAKEIRKLYATYEKENYGREWTNQEILQGLVGDVADLGRLMMANEGIWPKHFAGNRHKEKVAHELADCLWSIIILADKYDIDLEKAFKKAMDEIEERVKNGK